MLLSKIKYQSVVRPSSVHDTFGFPFYQCPWDLTKYRDNIVVADLAADMAANMEVRMVADMVADMFADIVAKN